MKEDWESGGMAAHADQAVPPVMTPSYVTAGTARSLGMQITASSLLRADMADVRKMLGRLITVTTVAVPAAAHRPP